MTRRTTTSASCSTTTRSRWTRSAAEETAELRDDVEFVTEAHDGGATEAKAKKTKAAKAEPQAAATAGVVEEEEKQQQPPRRRRGGGGGANGGGARSDLERFLVEERGLGGRDGVSYVRFVLAYLEQRRRLDERTAGERRREAITRLERSCSTAAARAASNLSRRRSPVPRTSR